MVYNEILRQSEDDYIWKHFRHRQNLFSTSIHALQSAVVKLAKVSKISAGQQLYRGVGVPGEGGFALPAAFCRADSKGRAGMVEWGFMSTTTCREVASEYSGADLGGVRVGTVIEMRTGSVDRGADIADFSQFPKEKEIVWAPLTLLEPDGTRWMELTRFGLLRVERVRVRANGQALTLEQLVEVKKETHLKSFESGLENLSLQFNREGVPSRLVTVIDGMAREVLAEHGKIKADDYALTHTFQKLTQEMANVLRYCKSKAEYWRHKGAPSEQQAALLELHLEPGNDLLACHRAVVSQKTITARSQADWREVCLLEGLISSEDPQILQGELQSQLQDSGAFGDLLRLRKLLGAGAGSHADDSKALLIASSDGHDQCVDALITARANVNIRDPDGSTSLVRAAEQGHSRCVLLLLNANADVDLYNTFKATALYSASRNGHVECVQLLIDAGAQIVRASNGRSALDEAMAANHGHCAQLLRNYTQRPQGSA
mmetsp:Transcript_13196/g.36442  ORF Transcript_13196/g.36442 Transcript_13196/m.36442 type:complete len:489 (-) Transcript_13196:304-1770(-)